MPNRISNTDFSEYIKTNKPVEIKFDQRNIDEYNCMFSFQIVFESGEEIEVSASTSWDQGILEYEFIK